MNFNVSHIASDARVQAAIAALVEAVSTTLASLDDDEIPMEYQVDTLTIAAIGSGSPSIEVTITSEV